MFLSTLSIVLKTSKPKKINGKKSSKHFTSNCLKAKMREENSRKRKRIEDNLSSHENAFGIQSDVWV
jgi:hypothetical protein